MRSYTCCFITWLAFNGSFSTSVWILNIIFNDYIYLYTWWCMSYNLPNKSPISTLSIFPNFLIYKQTVVLNYVFILCNYLLRVKSLAECLQDILILFFYICFKLYSQRLYQFILPPIMDRTAHLYAHFQKLDFVPYSHFCHSVGWEW